MVAWVVVGFVGLVAVMVALDVGVLSRRRREITAGEAGLSVTLWVLTALLGSVALHGLYESGAVPIDNVLRREASAFNAWLQFLTAYTVELSLSLDNLVVLALILTHFGVGALSRARILFYVFLACMVARAALIAAGASVLHWEWTRWVFFSLLVLAALRTLVMPGEHTNLDGKWLVRAARRLTGGGGGAGGGWWSRNPVVVLVMVAAADLSFALDSIPAVFSVTRDPLVAFTSNTLAILTLRSLFFAVEGVIGSLRYVRLGVVALLLTFAVQMALFRDNPMTTLVTLGVVLVVMGVSVAASVPHARRARRERALMQPAPIEDLAEVVAVTRRNLRKLAVLTAGTVVLLVAVLIGPLPGPGFIVVAPIGIGILATEFVWARRLVSRLERVQTQTDTFAKRTPFWLVPVVVVGFWAGVGLVAWGLHEWKGVRPGLVVTLLGGGFVPVGFWAYRSVMVWWRERKGGIGPGGTGEAGQGDRP